MNKKAMKRISGLILATLLLGTLTACGGNAGGKGEGAAEDGSAAQ